MGKRKHLTDEEWAYIKANVMVMSAAEIATALGRNYWTIHRAIAAIGASKSHKYTANDDFVIRRLYNTHGAKYIATQLGINPMAVYNRVKKLGIRKQQYNRYANPVRREQPQDPTDE